MARLTQIAHLLVLLALCAFIGVVGWQAWMRGQQLGAVLTGAQAAEVKLNSSLDKINQPGSGTLAEVDKTTLALKGVLVHADIATNHEDRNLTTLDVQESTLFADAHGTLTGLRSTTAAFTDTANAATGTLHGATLDLQTLNTSIAGLGPVETSASASLTDLEAFIKGPDVTGSAANLRLITGNFGTMSTDAQIKFHDLLYPPPCDGWKCKLGRDINDVRIGAQFIEPAFYLRQLLSGDTTNVTGTVTVRKGSQ